MYLQGWDINPLQSRLLQYIYTCPTIPNSAGSTSLIPFLEFLTAAPLHHKQLLPHQQIF